MIKTININRSRFIPITWLPLYTPEGDWMICQRWTLPTKRLNDSEVKAIRLRQLVPPVITIEVTIHQ